MMYLLDSNAWIAILRKKYPQVAARYGATNRADIRSCSVVVAELRYGCAKSAKPVANRERLTPYSRPLPAFPTTTRRPTTL